MSRPKSQNLSHIVLLVHTLDALQAKNCSKETSSSASSASSASLDAELEVSLLQPDALDAELEVSLLQFFACSSYGKC